MPILNTLLQIRNTVMFVYQLRADYAFLSAVLGTLSRSEISQKPFLMWLYLIISAMSFHQWTAETHVLFKIWLLDQGKTKDTNRLWKFKAKKQWSHSFCAPFIYSLKTWFFKILRQWPYFLYLPNLFLFILFYSDKSSMKHLQPMHISQNYFCQTSSVTCPWDMTCSKVCIALSTRIFQDNAIMTNSIILH